MKRRLLKVVKNAFEDPKFRKVVGKVARQTEDLVIGFYACS